MQDPRGRVPFGKMVGGWMKRLGEGGAPLQALQGLTSLGFLLSMLAASAVHTGLVGRYAFF